MVWSGVGNKLPEEDAKGIGGLCRKGAVSMRVDDIELQNQLFPL